MIKGQCSKYFSKKFQGETMIDEHGLLFTGGGLMVIIL